MALKIIGCLPQFSNTGDLEELIGVDVIIKSYFMILLTPKGKRVWQPEFGCDLRSQVFSLATSENLDSIRNDVKSSLMRWEPRADLKEVHLEYLRNEKVLILTIEFSYSDRDYTQEFKFDTDIRSMENLNIYDI